MPPKHRLRSQVAVTDVWRRLALNPPDFLWLDYRHNPSALGLFPSLQASWSARRLVHPPDTSAPIRDNQPQFLCFEFDTPSDRELALLHQTHLQYPDLPILMITAATPPAGAQAAFRLGIWDLLVNPVTASDLNASLEAFAQFCRQRHHRCPAKETAQDAARWPRTAAARQYLESHFAESVHLPFLADLCHLSGSEFSRSFRQENGLPFSSFLLRLRIHRACELLSVSATPIKCVAFEVGFNDVSYFTRVFHHHTGLTPSAFQHSDSPRFPRPDNAPY